MIDIFDLLNERLKYCFNGRCDEWLDTILKEKPFEFTVLVPVSMFNFDYQLRKYGILLDEYNIKCVIKTKSPLPRTMIWFNIITFTKEKVDKIILATYPLKPYCFDMKNAAKRNVTIRDLTEDYKRFVDDINEAVINFKSPNSNIYVINYRAFDKSVLNPECYSESSLKIKEEIRNNKNDFKKLSEIADINPCSELIKVDKFLFVDGDSKLLLHENIHSDREIRVCKSEQGDIILKKYSLTGRFSVSIVDEKNAGCYVETLTHCLIRINDKKMIPYVLFYFSDPKTLYYFMSIVKGSSVNNLSVSAIKELPIMIPSEEMINNSKELLELKKESNNISIDDVNKRIRDIKNTNKYDSETKKIINLNISEALSILKTKMAYEVINDDLKELDTCYLNGAYKASIILCGSILEAILLDWLSEYEDTEKITNVAINEENGRDKDLKDIINELYELVIPKWREKYKAHEIRAKRNYVHPKVCLRNDIHLEAEDVKKIIEDLKDIIDSRLNRE